MQARELVLASASPRRRRLLSEAGVRFRVQPADIVEAPRPGEDCIALARRLAREKALAIAGTVPPGTAVLGSDTVVVLGGEAIGKPRDAADAEALLGRLVGRTHQVVTAVALAGPDGGGTEVFHVTSEVHMRPAEADEIARYVATGEPLDKAGAYAVQGEGRRFVERVEGSETNVIGLPMDETLARLRALGLAPGGTGG